MYFRSEGIILRRRNFGEADRLLTIYTRDVGKISAIAKGVRRPRSRKAGHVELGNWCKMFIAKGKNIDILCEVELKKAFGIEEFHPKVTNRIYHLLEIVDNLTPHGQKNMQVFALLVDFLRRVQTEENFNLLSGAFKVKLLNTLGFFSAASLKDSQTKTILKILEEEKFDSIKEHINLSDSSYLKLLQFLDSMIENLANQKLTTVRFL